MNNLNGKLVVFDLDGTLNKTHLYSVPAHKKALAEFGIFDKTDEFIISTYGSRAQDSVGLLMEGCDSKTATTYLKKVSQYESEFITDLGQEFDGVSTMLDKLKESGYQTAVCSNASERYIRMVLNALKLIDKIDYIQPLLPDITKNDTLEMLLKRVNPTKAVMVGDRYYDKDAARYNHIPFIGCLYGFKSSDVEDADIAVKSPIDIYEAVETLIG
ncbi:HAD family hydrolase [Paludicola sp. MB14-C6]|uniref:HAD family hydrolase n=1 Tax=Paludihabitans sp. MB14-C6 TaxID=3070656 RepID=UPI0027DCC2F6|nr:HAD family hydrolase [Paludicola sp. MB14-C6]WMJ23533.1 HAD family hydrolase [Paludicola sp. MB14-C6]